MPKKIILVRHGTTDFNQKRLMQGQLDIPLNTQGKKDANNAADLLRHHEIDVVFSSDLIRAYETAQAYVRVSRIKVYKTHLLRERDFGKLEGKTYEYVWKRFDGYKENGSEALSGKEKKYNVESTIQMKQRVFQFSKLLKKHKNKTVAVFSHGGLIRVILSVYGIPNIQEKFRYIDNGSLIILSKKGETYFLDE
ncbi:MAG: histidine phosphatase family protein [Patescibacteria group bacterium]